MLDKDGTLTISGTGEMEDYQSFMDSPWYPYEDSLLRVIIEEGITRIGDMAFVGKDNITSISVPASVIDIGEYAFGNCGDLIEIDVNDESQFFKDIEGVLFSKDGTELIVCPAGKQGEYEIPYYVEYISSGAFMSCDELIYISIPDSVKCIGDEDTFSHCSKLTEIILPDCVTSIGDYSITVLREVN